MQRQDLILKILKLWTQETSLGEGVDRRNYTHASAGYETAQSDVEEILEMSQESLEAYLARMQRK